MTPNKNKPNNLLTDILSCWLFAKKSNVAKRDLHKWIKTTKIRNVNDEINTKLN